MVGSAIVQAERTVRDLQRVAKPALAGLLAGLLIAFGLLASSGPLHQFLHHNGALGTSFCAVCLLANGQVEPPNAGSVLFLVVSLVFGGLLPVAASISWDVDFLLPPGRAPPRLSLVS